MVPLSSTYETELEAAEENVANATEAEMGFTVSEIDRIKSEYLMQFTFIQDLIDHIAD